MDEQKEENILNCLQPHCPESSMASLTLGLTCIFLLLWTSSPPAHLGLFRHFSCVYGGEDMGCATVSKEADDHLLTPLVVSPMLCPQLLHPLLQKKSSSSCISLVGIKSQASGEDGVVQGLSATLEHILLLGLSQSYFSVQQSKNEKDRVYPSFI